MSTDDLGGLFERVVAKLGDAQVDFAVAGGLAASLYRRRIRTTNDIDVIFDCPEPVVQRAEAFVRALGLDPHLVRKADLEGGPMFSIKRRNTPVWIVAGRDSADQDALGVDLLLLRLPWAPEALRRAQLHRVDFGFGPLPTVPLEDLMLAKMLAVNNRSDRYQDLDDLRSILEAGHALDLPYLGSRMEQLGVPMPQQFEDLVPQPIARVSRRVRRRTRTTRR